MLKKHGDWMDLGGADEQKEAKEVTVEAWGRSTNSGRGLVWIEERASRPVWRLHSTTYGRTRSCWNNARNWKKLKKPVNSGFYGLSTCFEMSICRGGKIRTCDLLVPNQAR